jgi:hypothetical protein
MQRAIVGKMGCDTPLGFLVPPSFLRTTEASWMVPAFDAHFTGNMSRWQKLESR